MGFFPQFFFVFTVFFFYSHQKKKKRNCKTGSKNEKWYLESLSYCSVSEETDLLFDRKALWIIQGFMLLSTRILYSESS